MFKSLFRFSIRDVLWLMVVIGLALGWWVDRRGIQQDRDIWKYHAEGANFLSLMHAREIEYDGKVMNAKDAHIGTITRTWPESSLWHDDPRDGPDRPRKPKP